LLSQPPDDANRVALVIRADWRHFSILLTADAEQEIAPAQTGAVDVLKVAHHGSADAGLDHLLETSVPDLAVISVGADNTYGHPTSETLGDLAEHRVPVLRTDEDGTIEIAADASSWRVETDP
jgi:competence protein ComEC